MPKASGGLCAAGVVLLVVAGCAIPESFGLNFFQTTAPGHDRVVAASLESVSESTQAGLRRLGMSVVATPQGEDLRIAARTAAGEQFVVVLTRVKTEQGERTRVRLEGGTGSHEQTVFQILARVDVQQGH
jgi:hypothetical protein